MHNLNPCFLSVNTTITLLHPAARKPRKEHHCMELQHILLITQIPKLACQVLTTLDILWGHKVDCDLDAITQIAHLQTDQASSTV